MNCEKRAVGLKSEAMEKPKNLKSGFMSAPWQRLCDLCSVLFFSRRTAGRKQSLRHLIQKLSMPKTTLKKRNGDLRAPQGGQ